ncbi:MAG: TetR/AcrR family transcriptional regulator [Actinomycetota bacterium]
MTGTGTTTVATTGSESAARTAGDVEPSPTTDSPPERPDGRHVRRFLNRSRVIDAFLDFVSADDRIPTMQELSDRSGVSIRSVFRYFDGRDDLIAAAMGTVAERAADDLHFDGLGEGPFEQRVERFVMHRLTMYETFGALARVTAREAVTDPFLAQLFEAGRTMLREQFVAHFAPELDQLSAADRQVMIATATVSFQLPSFEFLHDSLDNDRDLVDQVLRTHLLRSFGPS